MNTSNKIACECGKRVANAEALKQHLRDSPNHAVHCECGARFKTTDARDQHMRDKIHKPKVSRASQKPIITQAPKSLTGKGKQPATSVQASIILAASQVALAVARVPAPAPAPAPAPEIKPPTETTASNKDSTTFSCCGRKFKAEKHLLQHRENSPKHLGKKNTGTCNSPSSTKTKTAAAAPPTKTGNSPSSAKTKPAVAAPPTKTGNSPSSAKTKTGNSPSSAKTKPAVAAPPTQTGNSPSSAKTKPAAAAPPTRRISLDDSEQSNWSTDSDWSSGDFGRSTGGIGWSTDDLDWSICDKDCGWCGHCMDNVWI
ncbi:hypothetical protein QBC43DRAFT_323158 [Cladorrhinum sp. PSN259]|nr:hypothetical protein QBC43DRAFT_323158 [Cladorrhinum sp. PSN259]